MPKKHQISYIKPEEPNFLKKLKQQIGYKEGPTVDTKREELEQANEDDFRDNDEELPQIVVLRPGDLTAAEAHQEELKLKKELEEKPADLNTRIVFKKPTTSNSKKTLETSLKRPNNSSSSDLKSKKEHKKKNSKVKKIYFHFKFKKKKRNKTKY